MKSTTLFSLYCLILVFIIGSLGWVTLYSIEKARWWDARILLAKESHTLHMQLETNVVRLFKQHSDALLIGGRDLGAEKHNIKDRISKNIQDIRNVIAREIEMVGEEEIEELELLERIEADIRGVNNALLWLSASEEPLETPAQIEQLAFLDRKIDIHLAQLIQEALEEEVEEVEETIAEAAAFRDWNESVAKALLTVAIALLFICFLSFRRTVWAPLGRLKDSVASLRMGNFTAPIALGGSQEFRDLGVVLKDMAANLSEREASRKEQKQHLESTVERRTVELQRLIGRLELGEDNRKRLMADISHELRTPLTIILGEAEVALRNDRDLSNETSDALTRIRDSAKHTNKIVDDMLTIARHEAGHLRLDLQETDLRDILKDADSMFPEDITLNLPAEPARLPVDAVRLRQAILALFQNARRHGGLTITAALVAMPEGYRITVEDDGPGMNDDEKRNAFVRFFRGSNASGQGIEGSGLGLPVVKSIIEAHGGHVALADEESGGLRIEIDLPGDPSGRPV